jgi:hypothetical protein
MGEMRKANKILVGKPEGKSPLGRPRRRWEENITLDLREIWGEVVDWIHLAQIMDQLRGFMNTVMNFCVSETTDNFLTNGGALSF